MSEHEQDIGPMSAWCRTCGKHWPCPTENAVPADPLREALDQWRIALESIERHSGDPGSRFVAAQALRATPQPSIDTETLALREALNESRDYINSHLGSHDRGYRILERAVDAALTRLRNESQIDIETLADAIVEHRFDQRGNCACGKARQLTTPREVARHLAEAVAARLRNESQPDPKGAER